MVPSLAAGVLEERSVKFEGIGFRVVALEPAEVRLVWRGGDGRPLRSFDRVLKHRNGVGIDKDGKLVFAMTARDQETNLHTFARLFLNFGCEDALFLDGDISQMAVNPKGPVESNRFGAVLVVTGE